ncbi:Arc family DNA-binding protein [Acinetobacter celticus]|uniref:Arc-like DNA binding domain-containing protein n=1 Tax=Acinetobacter celticus TaxID=1891224 RepID=A0A1C3CV42_9GAMM|nr:Arc family DNA-binding protein [Acinetobacter celticus]ODA12601.1 hypothetical protein BBP83_08515 [Acinetobacter celticus]
MKWFFKRLHILAIVPPSKLKEQIEKSANNNERSITAELVARLEQSLALYPEDHPINMSPEELMQRTTQTVAKEVVEEFIERMKKNDLGNIKIEFIEKK